MKKKVMAVISIVVLVSILIFVFLKFFLNVLTACVVAFVIVVALSIFIILFLKKRYVFEDSFIDFFKDNWFIVLFLMFFGWGGLCLLFLQIENIPPEKTVEIIQAQRLPNKEITKRISCDSIQRFIEQDVSVDSVKHYRYRWGVMRNHIDTIKHKTPSYVYTFLRKEYNLKQDTILGGYTFKCGEKTLVDVQERYFEGSKYKPFTRLIISEYNENGFRTYSEFRNSPQSENDDSSLYDLFFDGAQAQWSHTINVPRFYCSLASGKTSGYYATYAEAQNYCDEICKKSADKLLSGFDYTQYKACLSTLDVYRSYKEEIVPCGVAKITVNRKRGFLSRRPYSCNSTGTWEMIRE